ncbi:MAG: sigma-70 family RNA polymerase sigma factor [Terracidiphilus sp.]|jgi:RNA polymerase sigma-70 factor (ECF subfamily)
MPSQPVEASAAASITAVPELISHVLVEELWSESGTAAYGLEREQFRDILERVASAQNFGLGPGEIASRRQQRDFFYGLRLADLVLARACANGHPGAWEHFLATYRQPLTRAAVAITGSDTLGRELADQLYAELYGLTTRDGVRRSPLDSYRGRGSLMGWLRTTLAQRHVDHYRSTRRELPLDDPADSHDPPAAIPEPENSPADLLLLGRAIEEALCQLAAEERFLLAAYYLDGRTLLEIAPLLHVHEATVSRKLHRVTSGLQKQILRNLQGLGLSKPAAQEALGVDPRDLNVNLKKILQISSLDAFQEKAVS